MSHHRITLLSSLKLIGLTILLFDAVSGANILITEDLASPSHQIWNYAIADALGGRGHNVTILGPKTMSIEHKKFHFIPLEGLAEATVGTGVYLPEALSDLSLLGNIRLNNEFSLFVCNHTIHTKGLERLMDYPADFKFDLIILDLTLTPCFLPLIQRFNLPPAVGVSAFILPPNLSESFGNTFPVSYLPYLLLRSKAEMNYYERLQNFFFSKLDYYWQVLYSTPIMEQMSRGVFGEKMQSLDTLGKKVSLLLCNLSPGFHYPQPLTPNIIPVGGLHIDTEKKLPEELQDIMDSAKDGVILFSLGSNVRSDTLELETRNNILKAFSQMKQTVLWKFESDLTNLPKNVIIRKWLPQTEILAHPNLRLFITHGGGLSTIEASFFGIPMVGMPLFVDQHSNMKLVEYRELGIVLDFNTLSSEILLESVNNVLTDQKYSNNAKKISMIMRDQPQTSMERALFWIEFAMRNNGTNIYDPPSRHLSAFVLSSLDVYFLIVLLFSLLVYYVWELVAVLLGSVYWKRKHYKKIKIN